jgi:hypothetical protein
LPFLYHELVSCNPAEKGKIFRLKTYNKNPPVASLEWPRGFQEVKVPRFHDNGTG